jgi:hypothetical protein
MRYKDKFPELYTFFAGYFNQDWVDMYEFESGKKDALEVVRFYKTEDSADGIKKTVAELEEFLKLGLNDEELDSALDELGSDYYAPGDNWINREWLEKTLEILKDPNAKSKITGRADYGQDPPTEEMLAILRE